MNIIKITKNTCISLEKRHEIIDDLKLTYQYNSGT